MCVHVRARVSDRDREGGRRTRRRDTNSAFIGMEGLQKNVSELCACVHVYTCTCVSVCVEVFTCVCDECD